MIENPNPRPTPTGTHTDAPESADPLVWYSRESFRKTSKASKYYSRYESATHGKITFAIKENRRDSHVDLLVHERGGSWDNPIVRYSFAGAREAKKRAERFLVENDLYLS